MTLGSGSIPPKERAIEGIIWRIASNSLNAGDKLPGERILCEQLGVSRTALRGAIKQLSSQGLLESRHGSGTYVLPPKPTHIFQRSGSFTDIVSAAGRRAHSLVIQSECTVMDELVASKMEGEKGTPIFKLKRVRYADDQPISIELSHINLEYCPTIATHDFSRESLLAVIRKEHGLTFVHGDEQLSITTVTAEEAKLLQVEAGTPAFFEQCRNRTQDGIIVEYCRAIALADRFQYASDDTQAGSTSQKVEAWLKF
ncbi:GntR family transcriptional regulator [Collinsella sp. AGMB00827]|uniref:GntR family transcriptional regulator n=1 Tax=Collinsella ureilytica TaxID=2869515 RepID=A0ABS7MKG3_9ACTN|nr:GntR family transcriptional regulator [Collinsella urealyticum]MBY4797865.1 GntR family transcriptional regulator [Collinsella urealyticum]